MSNSDSTRGGRGPRVVRPSRAAPAATRTRPPASGAPAAPSVPVAGKKAGPRAFRLDPARLAAARRVLGTPNDTATIDAALDYIVFGRELRAGAEALAGMTFDAFDRDTDA